MVAPQLVRPALRPLIAERLVPPKDPETGVAFEGTPVETPKGLVWTDPQRTRTPNGILAYTIPGGQAVWALLARRWWHFRTDAGPGYLDAVTGKIRVFSDFSSGVGDESLDEYGVPVGFRRSGGSEKPLFQPCHGETLLKMPPDFASNDEGWPTIIAAPKGPIIAGALSRGSDESTRSLPFLWSDDDASPKALPMPEGYSNASVEALNSRGDVAGFVSGADLPNRAVIWRGDGRVTFIPVASTHSDNHIRDDGNHARWAASDPKLITDEGLVIGSEWARDTIYGYITTLWDGRRTMWLPDAIEGVKAKAFGPIRLAEDGRSFLMRISDGKSFGWYRVSPR